MKITWKGNDISDLVNTVTWSGSAYSSARSLEFALPNPAGDPNVKTPNIKTGDLICFMMVPRKSFMEKLQKRTKRRSRYNKLYSVRLFIVSDQKQRNVQIQEKKRLNRSQD